ncbi:MAG: prolyl oligopeptidase family serine peptidase [Oligoflexia bacterium]|nr:prolyl oligopeptidase family serine peptidase [Oligoflexia bacterium]
MDQLCYFCKREPAVHQCETCKRWVCIQCSDCHNCYPREGRARAAFGLLGALSLVACAHGGPAADRVGSPQGYSGYGAESVPAEVLARFAPPPVKTAIASRVEALLDVRSPGAGEPSPDGKRLYFGWTITGVAQVWKLEAPLGFPSQLTGGEDPTTLSGVSPDGRFLVLARDRKGEEDPGLYVQPVEGGPLREILHRKGVQTELGFISDDSRYLYYRANDIKRDSFAIYRHDLGQNERKLLFSEPGYWMFADRLPEGGRKSGGHHRLLLGKATGSLTAEFSELDEKTGKVTPVLGQNEREEYEAQFSALPGEYLVLTPKFGDFKRLYRYKAGKFTPITPELRWDVAEFQIDPSRRRILYTVNEGGYFKLFALDARTFRPIATPEFKDAAKVHFGRTTRNGRFTTISVERSDAPRSSFVYDWSRSKLSRWVAPNTPEIDTRSLPQARLDAFPARDGTPIPYFVTVPKKCEAGVAERPCPVVVHFHGGPEGQSEAGYKTVAQILAGSGFIFVEPNVRGSSGYGKTWLAADDGAKRLQVITDIEDCALFAKKEFARNGVAPKVGVMGGSYGGYATLMAMSRFAGSYEAGASIVGISNLITFIQNTAPYRRHLRISEYGDPEKDRDAMVALSPTTYLDRVKAPLLIIQGVSDPRVPAGEAVQMHESLVARGVKSSLILFGDEGHGAAKRSNSALQYGNLIQFFEEQLK